MAVNPVLRQLVADGKATKNAQSGTQTKMTAAKSAAQANPVLRSLNNQQKTTSGAKKTDALTSAIISTNQKAAQKKTATAERGSKHYTNRANQQRRAQAQVVANQIKKNNAERANKYSLGKGVAGAVAKGVNQAAQGVASTLALAEDVALAPFELFSGQKLGDLSDTAPLNKLSQRIKNEGQETQKKYADNVAKGGKAAELLDKYGSATVAAVPQAVMAYLTAGASAGASTAGLGAQATAKMTPSMAGTIRRGVAAMAKDPNYWTAFSQVVGQSYDEAMDDMAKTGTENNKARTKAALYAMGNGLLNAAVEVGGGIQKLPEELKHGANAWKAWVDSAVDEGKEEVVQGVIERALQNGVYHKGNKLASLSDDDAILNPRTAAEEFAGGAVVGGVLGGGQIGVNAMLNAMNGRGKGAETPDVDAGARQATSEGNFTPAQENAAEGAQGASKGAVEVEDIKIEPPTRTTAEAVAPENTGGSTEAPSPASDGTSALSGDLDHVASGDASTDTAPRTNQTSLAADGGAGVQAPVSLDPTVTQGNSGVKGEDMQRGGNYAPSDGLGAADAGFDPFTAAQNEYGTLPSGEKPVRPDDAPRSTNGEDRVSQTVVTAKGAQITPDEFVPLIENETMKGGFSFIPVSNNDVTQRATARIAEKGWSRALADWTSDVRAGKAGDSITATGALLYNYAVNSGDTGLALSVLSDYATAVRNSARGLQAARIMKTLTPSNRLYMMEQNIRNLAERLGITDGLHLDKELAQQYLDAQDDAARDKIIEDIQQDVADQIPSTLLDKWTAWRYVNMLGNFKTQGRNFVGNVGMQAVQRVKDGIATALESIAYHASGGKFERTKSFAAGKELRDAAKADFKNVRTVALGEGKYHEGGDSDAFLRGVEDKRTIFKNNGDWGTTESSNPFVRAARITTDTAAKGLEGYRRATNWAMEQGDVIFSKGAYANALAGYLKAHQVTAEQFSSAEWQSRNGSFVDKARLYAIKEAQESTFRDSNTLSSWVSRIGRRRDTPKVARIAAEGLAPFRKTPANVLVRAKEYSPLGLINTAIDSIKAYRGAKGETTFADADITGADIINSLSKTLTGTGLFLAGMALQNAGLLRGGDDDDDNQATFDDLTGHQAYSLELPNGVSYTLDWMTPAAMPLFMGAQLNELRQDSGIELKDLEKSLTSIAEPMLEMSMLSGVNSTIDELKYSDDNFGQLAISLAVSYLTQGLTNSLVGQLERTSEDVRMSTYTDKNSAVPTWLQKTIGKSSAKMPGVDYHQIPYVDQWGEEEPSGDVLSRAIQNTLSTGYYSKVELDDTEKELARLAEATGETSVYPKWIDKSFMVDGETKNLTAEEYTKYAKTTGQTRKSAVDALMKNSGYQKLSDENKVKAVQRAYEYANAKGKMAVSSYTPTGFAKGAMRSVLPIDSYILYTLTSDRDHSGSTDSKESAQTLQSMPGLTDRQRGKAWEEKNSTTKPEKNPFTGALVEAGASVSTSISILDKYRELYNADGMKPKEKAADFRAYVYGLGLTPSQIAAAQSTYTFFGSYPIEW